jgi:hypothetical protein
MLRTITVVSAVAAVLALGACASNSKTQAENEAVCKAVKPGTVTSVNSYCVIMLDDPVDPTVVRDFKGQTVGFCCSGCLKKWDAMSDAQKDAAIKVAVAKGKPAA